MICGRGSYICFFTNLVNINYCIDKSRMSGRVWDDPKLLSSLSRLSIVPVFEVLYYTAAKRGPCQLCRRKKLTSSTNDASVVFLELSGNIKLPMKKCWDVLVLPLYTPPSASAALAG